MLLIDWRRREARMHRQALQVIGEQRPDAIFPHHLRPKRPAWEMSATARIALLRSSVRPLAVRPVFPARLLPSHERFAFVFARGQHCAPPAVFE